MDGTPNKKNLGANAILGVSLATAHAAADCTGQPLYRYLGGPGARMLPAPMMNIVNGGQHADNSVDVQEFMVMPLGFDRFSDALRCRRGDFPQPEESAAQQGAEHDRRRRRRFRPRPGSNQEALDLIMQAIEAAGYKPASRSWIALDVAATEFYDSKKKYSIDGKQLSGDEMVDFLAAWCDKYPICSIEDGCSEDDWDDLEEADRSLGDKVQLVGDDLFVTNVERLQRGIDEGIANSILIKVNQIGTLTETIDAIQLAHRNGYTSITSHRSGETEDSTIADLAVAMSTGQIKTGSASRSDRMAKYNQLLRIEEMLGGRRLRLGVKRSLRSHRRHQSGLRSLGKHVAQHGVELAVGDDRFDAGFASFLELVNVNVRAVRHQFGIGTPLGADRGNRLDDAGAGGQVDDDEAHVRQIVAGHLTAEREFPSGPFGRRLDLRTERQVARQHHDAMRLRFAHEVRFSISDFMNANPFLANVISSGYILRQILVAAAISGSDVPNASTTNQPS
jgi:enolase